MQEALQKMLEAAAPLNNPSGIAEPLIELIARDLTRFEAPVHLGFQVVAGAGGANAPTGAFPARLLKYVVDGADHGALGCIKVYGGWSSSSGDGDGEARAIRWQIYDHWEAVSPNVLLRFARVLAASSQLISNNPILDLSRSHPWVEALVRDLVGEPVTHARFSFSEPAYTPHGKASFARLQVLLELDDLATETLLRSAFTSRLAGAQWDRDYLADFVAAVPGFGAAVSAHKAALLPLFRAPGLAQKLRLLSLMARAGPEAQAVFGEELVDLALDGARQVRDRAWPMAMALGARAEERALERAVTAAPEQRALALRLLWQSDLPEARTFVRERGTTDKAESVRTSVAGLIAAATETAAPAALNLPAATLDVTAPTSEAARALLAAWLAGADAATTVEGRRWLAAGAASEPVPLAVLVEAIVERVERPQATPSRSRQEKVSERFWALWQREHDAQLQHIGPWLAAPGVALIHVVRLLCHTGQIWTRNGSDWVVSYPAVGLLRRLVLEGGRGSLFAFAQALAAEGVPASTLIEEWYSRSQRGSLTHGWPDAAIWPFFIAYPEALDAGFNTNSPYARAWDFDRMRVFDALATFPVLPPQLVPRIVELALGPAKDMRAGAQRVLAKHPDRFAIARDGLASGRAETRAAAAQWLARLKEPAAIAALETALQREKNDAAQGAMLTAMEALGASLEPYLNANDLGKAAAMGLNKGIPQDLRWFPFAQLPKVRWAANGAPVAGQILTWFVVQAGRLRTPEPGALLRRYCAMFCNDDREALGAFVLSAWLAHDLQPAPRQVAEQRAGDRARQMHAFMQRYPQHYATSPLKDLAEDQLVAHFLAGELQTPGGSAIGAKGVLALAAACGGGAIAPAVEQYLKQWYGYRAAQGKALIQMLAWVEHPAATQLMLSVGSRFRTKGIQEEASKQAALLAERKGWTLDELADRTIATAGFDATGRLELDYGERTFIACLGQDGAISLQTADGKPIKTLPEPRQGEAAAPAAKKRLGAARKEVKSILNRQRDRLYEAMCTGRGWRLEDWRLYFIDHPIMRGPCQRLVWGSMTDDAMRESFRPLDDGTLTDADDQPVVLAPDATVRLAHESNCASRTREAWIKHFADYQVAPLFQQFGKGTYRLAPDKREARSLGDFQGHMLDAYKLRGAASKLDYMRGATEDGGWFYAYRKRFATMGIEAVLGFSGNRLPEENRQVALTNLSFESQADGDGTSAPLPLNEVPPILLSECWNDMRLIAGHGTGFDREWQKKVEG